MSGVCACCCGNGSGLCGVVEMVLGGVVLWKWFSASVAGSYDLLIIFLLTTYYLLINFLLFSY